MEAEEGVGLPVEGTAQDNEAGHGMENPTAVSPAPGGGKKVAAQGRRGGARVTVLLIALLALGIGLWIGLRLWNGALSARAELPQVDASPPAGVPTPGPVGIVLAAPASLPIQGPALPPAQYVAGQYASTGGWTLAARPVMEIFASQPLIKLTPAQQQRLETVAEGVYRPCCGNSTAFPDCNHGMAMLGILELMAAGDASEDEMFEAAKYVSAFWFPKEMTQAAAYYKLAQGQDFGAIDPRRIVSRDIFSMAGAQFVQQWLTNTGHAANMGHLGQPQDAGGSCGA